MANVQKTAEGVLMDLETAYLFLEAAKTAERIHRPAYVEDRRYDELYVLCYTCASNGGIEWPCEPVETFRKVAEALGELTNGE